MLKKIWAFVIAVAIVASCCLIPASAASLEGTLIANFDFSTGEYENTLDSDAFTNPEESALGDGQITFVEDETLGKQVLKIENKAIQYALSDQTVSDLSKSFTYETYIYIPGRAGRFSLVCGTIWYGQGDLPNQGAAIVINNFGTEEGNSIGGRNTISACAGKDKSMKNIEGDKKMSFGKWVHLVYVHDDGTDYFYMNGVDMSNGGSESHKDLSVNKDQGFRIGGYNLANNFDTAEMYMAYCKVYASAATAEDVKAMCSNLGIQVDSSNSNSNSNSNSSASKPTSVPSSNTDKNNQVTNTKTFDLGIVSLAAVALSSAVVVKKKKR